MERLILFLCGYLCGCIQSGYFYGERKNIDIRKYGSHNTGATNTLRVLGLRAGLIVFVCDFLKGLIPCLIVRLYFSSAPDRMILFTMWAAAGVVTGHDFPFWMKFKGGKGIASTAGVMTAVDPLMAVICIAFFAMITALTKYVSVGSISAMVLLFALLTWNCLSGRFGINGNSITEFMVLGAYIPFLAIFRHRANIVRLMKGKENKLHLKKKGGTT